MTGRSEVGDTVPAGPTGTGLTGHGGTAQAPTWPAGVYGAQTGGECRKAHPDVRNTDEAPLAYGPISTSRAPSSDPLLNRNSKI